MIKAEIITGTEDYGRKETEDGAVVATFLCSRWQFNRLGWAGSFRGCNISNRIIAAATLVGYNVAGVFDGEVHFKGINPFFHTNVFRYLYAGITRIWLNLGHFWR